MNRAKKVREALGLTPVQAGKLIIGIADGKKSYDMWTRWERSGKWPLAVNQYLGVLLILIIARDIGTPGAENALDVVIKTLSLE